MSVPLTQVSAVRIVCDEVLKFRVQQHLSQFGATGYTYWEVHGRGERLGDRRGIYIEVWCNSDMAQTIVSYCRSSEFQNAGMSVGVMPLWVSADEAAKFTRQ